EQHLEMTRTFAARFNKLYKTEYFNPPQAFNFGENLIKIPGLDGSGKMGKSEGEMNAIFFSDEPEVIRKKIMRAVTDAGPTQPNQEKPEIISNLFSLLKIICSPEIYTFYEDAYNQCNIRYGDLKKQLAQDTIEFTKPFREKIKALLSDDDYLTKISRIGAEKAKESAQTTLREVRQIIGF
ncbi:MAG: tryptophan--tRNA ligase, partial [Bacteroidales bacterium]